MNPIALALDACPARLSPAVRDHILQVEGTARYTGVMRRVWIGTADTEWLLRPILLCASRFFYLLTPTAGQNIPFDLVHEVRAIDAGKPAMSWSRIFYFPNRRARFNDVITYEDGRLVDWLGRGFPIASTLTVSVQDGAMVMESGSDQWLKIGRLKAPLPLPLRAFARVREWEDEAGILQVDARIWSPILGPICGYRGWFSREKVPSDSQSSSPAPPT